jgi:hypothetical protein
MKHQDLFDKQLGLHSLSYENPIYDDLNIRGIAAHVGSARRTCSWSLGCVVLEKQENIVEADCQFERCHLSSFIPVFEFVGSDAVVYIRHLRQTRTFHSHLTSNRVSQTLVNQDSYRCAPATQNFEFTPYSAQNIASPNLNQLSIIDCSSVSISASQVSRPERTPDPSILICRRRCCSTPDATIAHRSPLPIKQLILQSNRYPTPHRSERDVWSAYAPRYTVVAQNVGAFCMFLNPQTTL